jgi:hypothetical protein
MELVITHAPARLSSISEIVVARGHPPADRKHIFVVARLPNAS